MSLGEAVSYIRRLTGGFLFFGDLCMRDILILGAGKIGALISCLLAESGDSRGPSDRLLWRRLQVDSSFARKRSLRSAIQTGSTRPNPDGRGCVDCSVEHAWLTTATAVPRT